MSSPWEHFIVAAIAAATAPLWPKMWAAINRHDERKRLRYEAKRAARLERKAARKAAKEAAKGDHHTSVFIHTPPRLGHDGSAGSGSGEDTQRPT